MLEKQKAILIDVIPPTITKEQSLQRLQELEQLVNTYGGIVVIKTYQKRLAPHVKTFIGSGKAQQLAQEGKELGARLLVINGMLKPRQVYVLSEMLRPANIQVWDRIDLILKIFAKHAHTTEARLEIELASIRHMGPRIFGMGMELSRQGGGIGTVGIGETNIEIMKRHLRAQEQKIKEKLEKYQKVRDVHRKSRARKNLKTFSLVGYTNAGKTTLLNALTGRKEYADDKLFATLDTRVGELYFPDARQKVLVSDTIGFIQDLPPELIHAFQSTLSEAVDSNVLLVTIDASDSRAREKIFVVEEILTRLGMNEKPKVYVFNKMDKAQKGTKQNYQEEFADKKTVFVSAQTGQGLEELKKHMEKMFFV